LVVRPEKHLYVGETVNLRDRFEVQFSHKKFAFWDTAFDQLHVSFKAVNASTPLPQNQSRWISKWQPIGNYEELATKKVSDTVPKKWEHE